MLALRRYLKFWPILPAAWLATGCSGLLAILDNQDDTSKRDCLIATSSNESLRLLAYDPAFGPSDITHPSALQRRFLDDVQQALKGCVAKERSNLILLPDGMSDLFAIAGGKGQAARAASELTAQRAALADAYATTIAAYRRRFAGLDDNAALGLALANAVRSGAQATAGELAKAQGAYVAIALRLPQALEPTTNASEHAIFGDDEINPVTVYIAAVSTVVEMTMVFAPSGEPLGLVQRGFGPSAASAIYTATAQVPSKFSVFALPISYETASRTLRLAFWGESELAATALLQRIDDLGVDLLLLHGRLPVWAATETNVWLPNRSLGLPWLATQRWPLLYGGASAYLRSSGPPNNDGQAYIAEKIGVRQELAARLLGGEPRPGLLSVSPWALAETAASVDTADDAGRSALGQLAAQLQGTVGQAAATPQSPGLAAADLLLPSSGANAFGDAGALGLHQRNVQATFQGDQIVAIWNREVSGTAELHWGRPAGGDFASQGALAAGSSRAIRPRLAATPDVAVALWMQGGPGQERVRRASYDAATGVWTEAQLAESSTTAQWWPDVALINNDIHAVWYSLQATSIGLEARRIATDGTVSGGRVRQWPLAGQASQMPAGPAAITSVGQQLWLTWSEQSPSARWAVLLQTSSDAGATWSAPVSVFTGADNELIWDLTIEADTDQVEMAWSLVAADRQSASIVLASRSSDGSLTLRRPATPEAHAYQMQPTLGLGGNVTWLAWRQLSSTLDQLWLWSYSPDFGEIAAKAVVNSDASNFAQLSDPQLALGPENVLLFWSDGAAGFWRLKSLDLGAP